MSGYEELRKLAGAATRGPWYISGFEVWANGNGRLVMGADNFSIAYVNERTLPENEADASYIAACSPDVILALLDDNERLQHSNELLQHALELAAGRMTWAARAEPGTSTKSGRILLQQFADEARSALTTPEQPQ